MSSWLHHKSIEKLFGAKCIIIYDLSVDGFYYRRVMMGNSPFCCNTDKSRHYSLGLSKTGAFDRRVQH